MTEQDIILEMTEQDIILEITEQDIILEMKQMAETFLEALNKIKSKKAEIKNLINTKLDNNYFIERSKSYILFNNMFEENSMDEIIYETKNIIVEMEKDEENMCLEHEYILDHIDIGFEDTQAIHLCRFCGITPKDYTK